MATDVASHFAATRREAHEGHFSEIEVLDQRREIVGVRVHLVALRGLARSTVTTTIVGDAAKPSRREQEHLALPAVRAERPAMTEDHHRARAPVFGVKLRSVLRRQGGHDGRDCTRCASTNAPAGTGRGRYDR